MESRQRNHGLRKRCSCPRKLWAKCPHAWHFNFKWRGKSYRLSLGKETDHLITNRDEARAEADRLRAAIRAGKYPVPAEPAPTPVRTFRQFADIWLAREGSRLASGAIDKYRLKLFNDFVLPGTNPPAMFGDRPVGGIALGDIEAWREARREIGRSPVTINHDLKLLRKMFNWGIRKGYVERTPFKIGTEPAILLDRETPRNKRLEAEDLEQRLIDAAGLHLRAVIIAMLETACRPGEVLSLQWRDVSLDRSELVIQAEKAKTRSARIIPISSRLKGVLEMRRHDPAGEPFAPEAYVFGDSNRAPNQVGPDGLAERLCGRRARWIPITRPATLCRARDYAAWGGASTRPRGGSRPCAGVARGIIRVPPRTRAARPSGESAPARTAAARCAPGLPPSVAGPRAGTSGSFRPTRVRARAR